MADDEKDRMDAALAILGMANSAPPIVSSVSTFPQHRIIRNTASGSSSDTLPSRQRTASPNGLSGGPVMHIPVPKLPQPQRGVAVAKAHKPIKDSVTALSEPPVSKSVVLPKVPRNVLLRSKIESKIQAREIQAAKNEKLQSGPDPVKSTEMPPKKKQRRAKKRHEHKEGEAHALRIEPVSLKGSQETSAYIPSPNNTLYSGNYIPPSASRNNDKSIKKEGEFSSKPLTKTVAESITYASQRTSLESSQSTHLSQLTEPPKIETAVNRTLLSSAQSYSPPSVVTNVYGAKHTDQSKERPNLSLVIPPKTESKLPPVSYSPISPADSQPGYTVIGTPSLRTISNPMQSEPLDLSKDTKADTVPLMHIITPNANDASKMPLVSPDVTKIPLMSPVVQSPGAALQSIPLQYVSSAQQKLIQDGKLVYVVARSDQRNPDSNSSPVVPSPSAIVSNPSALLSNLAAYGMQLVQDPAAGHALLVPKSQIQEKSRPLSRQNSRTSLSPKRTNSSEGKQEVIMTQQMEPKSPKADSTPKPIDQPTSPPKPVRAQSTLPPKKRKFIEQEEATKKTTTPVSPTSVASNASSMTDEGYHTLKEDIVVSPVASTKGTFSHNVTKSTIFASPSLGIAQTQKFAHLGPQPRMSTGLLDSSRSRAAQALLLSKSALPKGNVGPDKIVAHSLPANLEHMDSPPATPAVITPQKDSMQELYAQKLFEEYQRSLREGSNVRPGKSPFQHFRPSRSRRSNTTKVSVDLTTGDNWKSSITAKMERETHNKVKHAIPEREITLKRSDSQNQLGSNNVERMPIQEAKATPEKPDNEEMVTEDAPPDQTEEEPSEELREGCKKAGQADEDGDLPIHIAVVHENLGAVEKLLYMMQIAKISVDHCNNDRQTPLHLAVITKNEAILSSLLQAGSNPNLADRKGCTGIHLAVKHNSRECLLAIFQESKIQPDLNAKNYEGYTALHMSVIHRNLEFVQLLLLAGAHKDIQDNKSGRTALFHAAETKQFNIASLLLQKGASVNIASYAGTTPAQAANGRGHSDLVALLIKYGADVSTNLREGEMKNQAVFRYTSSDQKAKNAVQRKLKERRRLLRRMGSMSDVTQLDPQLRSVQETSQHAHSLDIDINPQSGAGHTSDGKEGLKIVLPDPGIAASMPLSPSALGLATRKTLPMIPPMHAKSLPDDVVSKSDTQTSVTSPTSAQPSVTSEQMHTAVALSDQSNRPVLSPRIVGKTPFERAVIEKATSVNPVEQSIRNFALLNQKALTQSVKTDNKTSLQQMSKPATSSVFAIPSPTLTRKTRSPSTLTLGSSSRTSVQIPTASDPSLTISDAVPSAKRPRLDVQHKTNMGKSDNTVMKAVSSSPQSRNKTTDKINEVKQTDGKTPDNANSTSVTNRSTEQVKIDSSPSSQLVIPLKLLSSEIAPNITLAKSTVQKCETAPPPISGEVMLDPTTGEFVPVKDIKSPKGSVQHTDHRPSPVTSPLATNGENVTSQISTKDIVMTSLTSPMDTSDDSLLSKTDNITDSKPTVNKKTEELTDESSSSCHRVSPIPTGRMKCGTRVPHTRSDTLESDESVELSQSFLESLNAKEGSPCEEERHDGEFKEEIKPGANEKIDTSVNSNAENGAGPQINEKKRDEAIAQSVTVHTFNLKPEVVTASQIVQHATSSSLQGQGDYPIDKSNGQQKEIVSGQKSFAEKKTEIANDQVSLKSDLSFKGKDKAQQNTTNLKIDTNMEVPGSTQSGVSIPGKEAKETVRAVTTEMLLRDKVFHEAATQNIARVLSKNGETDKSTRTHAGNSNVSATEKQCEKIRSKAMKPDSALECPPSGLRHEPSITKNSTDKAISTIKSGMKKSNSDHDFLKSQLFVERQESHSDSELDASPVKCKNSRPKHEISSDNSTKEKDVPSSGASGKNIFEIFKSSTRK